MEDRKNPGTSTRGADGSREVGTNRIPPMIATAATGTLTMKIEPQEKCSRSQPPVIGPTATPTPTMAAHSPIALARFTGSAKMLVINESVVGKITAAPMPIAARAAMRESAEFTCAATAEVAAKTASPGGVGEAPRVPRGGEGEVPREAGVPGGEPATPPVAAFQPPRR